MLTLSVVRTGAEHVDPTVLMDAKAALHRAVVSGLIIDGQVAARGEDISLIMSHRRGADAPDIHGLLEGPTAYAELEFTERPDEQVVCLFADPMPPGVWNLPLYRMFADPLGMATAARRGGFSFEVNDLYTDERIWLDTAADLRALLSVLSTPSRYVASAVVSKTRYLTAAVTSARQEHAGPLFDCARSIRAADVR
jgi:fructose 1,6-bisphosphate aldolase/phosphatase